MNKKCHPELVNGAGAGGVRDESMCPPERGGWSGGQRRIFLRCSMVPRRSFAAHPTTTHAQEDTFCGCKRSSLGSKPCSRATKHCNEACKWHSRATIHCIDECRSNFA